MQTDILSILKSRRSHFRKEFTGEKLPDSLIEYLLECAHQAPTHKLTYPWRFKIFSGNSLKNLTQKIIEINNLKPDSKTEARTEKIKGIPEDISHVIAICMKREELQTIPETEEICAVACAVQNMYLGLLRFEEAGGYWSTGNGAFTPQMHQYLSLGTNDRCLGFFFVGKITNRRTAAGRPPWQNFVEWM